MHYPSVVLRLAILGSLCLVATIPSLTMAQEFACPYTWTKDLKTGSIGPEVLALQQFLNKDADTQIATSGVGSIGKESIYFGPKTAQAVARFQEKYHAEILEPQRILHATGRVGSATRTKLNTLCGTSSTISTTATTSEASAQQVTPTLRMTADNTIVPSLAVANALRIPFTSFTLEALGGDVTINTITVEQVGPADHHAFSTVSLLDEDGYVWDYGYFNVNRQVVLKEPIEVSAGTTQRFILSGDMAADLTSYDNQLAGLTIAAIDATASTTSEFPIRGAYHTINSTLTIGSATTLLSPFDPHVDRTYFINDSHITFSAIRLEANSVEDIVLRSITWEQTGTAGPTDIANIVTEITGRAYPTEVDGRWYTSTLDEPITIHKGDTIDVQLTGDLTTSGSNRTVKFNIHYPDDIVVEGKTYKYGIYPYASGNTAISGNSVFLTEDGTTDTDALTPFFSGSEVTISPGALITIGK